MKKHHIILTATLLLSITIGVILVKTDVSNISRTEYFTIKQLTDKQVTACDEFKSRSGGLRRTEADLVFTLGILPSTPLSRNNSLYDKLRYTLTGKASLGYQKPQFFMSREDVTKILGAPDSLAENNFYYRTGFEDGVSHTLVIRFRDGYVVSVFRGGLEIK
jgi:hypothetical protein